MTHWYVSHNLFICVACRSTVEAALLTSLIRLICILHGLFIYGTTHSYFWHDSFTCVACDLSDTAHLHLTWLIRMSHITYSYMLHADLRWKQPYSYVWYGSFVCVMTRSYVARLIHISDMTHSRVLHADLLWNYLAPVEGQGNSYVTWLIRMWHDSFVSLIWLILMCCI